MPHIILEGSVDLEQYYASFKPTHERSQQEILKTQDIFINKDRRAVLIEAIAIEDGTPQRFFIQAGVKDNRTSIRLYPGTDPIKTTGVKKLLAIIAKQIKDQHQDIEYGATNLGEFLR
jgi:hypothetical protein